MIEVHADIDHLLDIFGEPNPDYALYEDDTRHSALWRIPKKMVLYYSGQEYDHFDMPRPGNESDPYRVVTKNFAWIENFVQNAGYTLCKAGEIVEYDYAWYQLRKCKH